MPLDINRVKDDVLIWHAETVKALQSVSMQADEIKKLRTELDAAKRSLNESQELNESLKAKAKEAETQHRSAIERMQTMVNELEVKNKELAAQAAADRKRCEEMLDHPDVKRKRMEQFKARAAKDIAEAEKLERELATVNEPA